MNWRKHFLEAATLIGAAVICALVSNALASRERKLVLVSTPTQRVTAGASSAAGPARAPAPTQSTPLTPSRGGPPPSAVQPSPSPSSGVPLSTSGGGRPASSVQPEPTRTTDSGGPLSSTGRQPATTTRQPQTDTRQAIDRFPPHPDKAYIEIHGDDVVWLHSKGALFLDARRTSVYEQGHIPGARPFSVWESDIDDKVNKLYAERSDPKDQNQPIVVYCSGGDCEDSHMLAQKLWGIQFNNVYVYKDGFPDWQQRGGAVHTGATP